MPSAHWTHEAGATHWPGSVHDGVGQAAGRIAVHCPATQSTLGQRELPSLHTLQGTSGGAQSVASLQAVPAPHSSGAQLQLLGSEHAATLLPEIPE